MTGPDRSVRIVYANKMPAIVDLSLVPDPEAVFGVRPDKVARRVREIVEDGDFRLRVGEALGERYPPRAAAEIVEKRIYEGFPSRADEERKAAFHAVPWAKRAELAENFEDERLRELGRRLVYLEEPTALPSEQREPLDKWLHNRRHGRVDVEVGRTIAEALADIEKLKRQRPEAMQSIIEIEGWLRAQEPNRADMHCKTE